MKVSAIFLSSQDRKEHVLCQHDRVSCRPLKIAGRGIFPGLRIFPRRFSRLPEPISEKPPQIPRNRRCRSGTGIAIALLHCRISGGGSNDCEGRRGGRARSGASTSSGGRRDIELVSVEAHSVAV